jgi:hypothetical protein
MRSLKYLCSTFFLVFSVQTAVAVTMEQTEDSIDNSVGATATQIIHATLEARDKDGELHTSRGLIKPDPAVEVEDRRPMADWFKQPAAANISLIYEQDRLIRVIIYH